MRYLITGGAGFIGSHLAERLLDRGDHVVLLDNLSTGSMENIRHLKTKERMEYHLDAIENRRLVAELVDDADIVVHLAAAVGVKLIVESPVRTIETNVHGTEVVLSLANKKKKKVLIASTSEVYGLSAEIPFREDLIDDGDRMSALALQPHVALIEVSSGNDPGAECREESRA